MRWNHLWYKNTPNYAFKKLWLNLSYAT